MLGLLRRAVQAEARDWILRQPRARDRTCATFFAKTARRPGAAIRLVTHGIRLSSSPEGRGPGRRGVFCREVLP